MSEFRILVVEDNPLNQELVCDILQAQGYRTFQAGNGNEAMSLAEKEHPDLILMDIQLPGADGLTITRTLKANPHTCDIKIIALTAHAMKGDDDKAIEAGCDDYIAKPINTRDFPKKIAVFLEQTRK